MYILHLPKIGTVTLRFATLRLCGHKVYISGYDEDRNRLDFVMDKLVYPDDPHIDFGYCHIISYTMHGKTVPCNYYKSIH
jgi:hypothetical protein